ncbi:glycosyltransferase [Nostoc sp. CHAB 5784]|nr:glycosyltransferase [Nostoc mirabile CHAB5784]
MGKSIVVFSLTEIRRDPRVRRVATTLSDMGYQVTVIGMKTEECSISRESLDNYQVVRIDVPNSYSAQAMLELHKICPKVGKILDKIESSLFVDLETVPIQLTKRNISSYIKKAKLDKIFKKSIDFGYQVLGISKEGKNFKNVNYIQEILAIRSILLINLILYQVSREFYPDVYHCNDLDTLVAGVMGKLIDDKTLVYDAHEIYPEQLAEEMRSDIWYRFYTNLEAQLINLADGRITVCDSLGEYFSKKYRSKEFLTLRNCPSKKYLPPASILNRKNSPRVITYQGAYFQYRGLEEVIAAAASVEGAIFQFRGIGSHEATLKKIVQDAKLSEKVQFLPAVKVDQLVETGSECDIGLSPFISVCFNTKYCLPNKFFEYMMAGLALCSSDLIEMRYLTEKLHNGVLFDSKQPEALSNVLNELLASPDKLDEMRQQSYYAAVDEYNWENEQKKLIDYYTRL